MIAAPMILALVLLSADHATPGCEACNCLGNQVPPSPRVQTPPAPAYPTPVGAHSPAIQPTYYLADDSGFLWYHTDPAYLRRHVAATNAARRDRQPTSSHASFVPPWSSGSACSSGRCR